jgi:hypothetical protein
MGAAGAWLLADAKFKARILTLEEKIVSGESFQTAFQTKLDVMTIQSAASIADRVELHRQVDKLDSTKASKEMVEAFKQEITILRMEMDKRFDRLDRLMEYKLQGPRSQPPDDQGV